MICEERDTSVNNTFLEKIIHKYMKFGGTRNVVEVWIMIDFVFMEIIVIGVKSLREMDMGISDNCFM